MSGLGDKEARIRGDLIRRHDTECTLVVDRHGMDGTLPESTISLRFPNGYERQICADMFAMDADAIADALGIVLRCEVDHG